MGASCGGDTKPEEEPVFAALGLQTHHAYSVLDVKDVHGIRLAGHVISSTVHLLYGAFCFLCLEDSYLRTRLNDTFG